MSIKEGRWLCKSCGSECRGRDERCEGDEGTGGCGAARPEGTRFYLPENSPYVTDGALLADARSGVDWNCDHCGGANKGSVGGHPVTACAHCGNARDDHDAEDRVRDVTGSVPRTAADATAAEMSGKRDEAAPPPSPGGRDTGWSGGPEWSGSAPADTPRADPKAEVRTREEKAVRRPFPALPLIAAAVAIVLAALVWTVAFARYETSWSVTGHEWSRSVETEVFRTLTDEGWDPPRDARIFSSDIRIRSYREVLVGHDEKTRTVSRVVSAGTEQYACGTRDLGNGFFEDRTCTRSLTETVYDTETYLDPVYEDEPVYDTWHEWEVDRWVRDRSWPTAGRGKDRAWAEMPAFGSDRRERTRSETLHLNLVSDGETRRWHVGEPVWLRVRQGSEILAVSDFWGRIVSARGEDGAELDFRP